MSGKPGRSGKARTPEERQAKRRYAKMGGDAAAGRTPTGAPSKPLKGSVEHTPALLAAFPELANYPFPVTDSLALKDALEAALKQAKAHQALVELDEARVKRDKERGKLWTREQVAARDQSFDDYIFSRLSELTEAAVKLFPLESQAQARRSLAAVADDWRSSVATAMRTTRGTKP